MGEDVEPRCLGMRMEISYFGPEIIQDVIDNIKMIREMIKTYQDR